MIVGGFFGIVLCCCLGTFGRYGDSPINYYPYIDKETFTGAIQQNLFDLAGLITMLLDPVVAFFDTAQVSFTFSNVLQTITADMPYMFFSYCAAGAFAWLACTRNKLFWIAAFFRRS